MNTFSNFKGDLADTSELPSNGAVGDFYLIPVSNVQGSALAKEEHLWAWNGSAFVDLGRIPTRIKITSSVSALKKLGAKEKKTARQMKPSRAPRISRFYTKRFKYQ